MKSLKYILSGVIILAILAVGWWIAAGQSKDQTANGNQKSVQPTQTSSPNVKKAEYEMEDGVKVFHLTAEEVKHEVSEDVFMKGLGYNGGTPGPMIVVNEGDKVRIDVENDMDEPTSVHWHGLMVPNEMDGVPGVEPDSPKIDPGDHFSYEI